MHTQSPCELTFTPKASSGWYAAALSIEDFPRSNPKAKRLSVVPLQFLIRVYTSRVSCASKPKLIAPSPVDGSCAPVPPGGTYTATLAALSSSSGVRQVNQSRYLILSSRPTNCLQKLFCWLKLNLGVCYCTIWSGNVLNTDSIKELVPTIFSFTTRWYRAGFESCGERCLAEQKSPIAAAQTHPSPENDFLFSVFRAETIISNTWLLARSFFSDWVLVEKVDARVLTQPFSACTQHRHVHVAPWPSALALRSCELATSSRSRAHSSSAIMIRSRTGWLISAEQQCKWARALDWLLDMSP